MPARSFTFDGEATLHRVEVGLTPGFWRVRITLRHAAAVELDAVTAAGAIPVALARDGATAEATFRADGVVEALLIRPTEDERLALASVSVDPVAPWSTLAPDWRVGPLRFPARSGPETATLMPRRPPSWASRLTVTAAEAATIDGERIGCGVTAIVQLAVDPPLAPGLYRIGAAFTDDDGHPALVEPRLLLPGAASPLDALCALRRVGGARYEGLFRLSDTTATLLFRPREQAGTVTVAGLAVAPAPPWARLPGIVAAARTRRRARPGRPRAPKIAPQEAVQRTGPAVSIVTATRDGAHHLERFLTTLRATAYTPIELILIDNGSTDPAALRLLAEAAAQPHVTVLRDPRRFNFAALSNLGARHATGEIVVFSNNDIAFCDPAWLSHLVAVARRDDVGIAGARLVYPDGRVQHAGLVLAGEARVRHAERFLPGGRPGFGGRQRRPSPVSAVTGALMALRASLFRELDGFDAERYPVLLNDADLSLRARRRGLRNMLVPAALAVHHESATIGSPRSADLFARGGALWRYERALEAARFRHDFAAELDRDPCYPIGLDPLAADFRRRLWRADGGTE